MGTISGSGSPNSTGSLLELMGVDGPHDLPASYVERDTESMTANLIQVLSKNNKGRYGRESKPRLSLMTRSFSTEEWNECSQYSRRLDRYCREGRNPPGDPPPRYNEYRVESASAGRQ
jgi:hypothetical protein